MICSAAFQWYKRTCGKGSADADSEAPALDSEDTKQKHALENGGFEFDGNSYNDLKGTYKKTEL